MDINDKEQELFIIEEGTYYYKAILFILKNARATYQRLMNKIFKDHIRRNIKVYVDDMIVKSKSFEEHVEDL